MKIHIFPLTYSIMIRKNGKKIQIPIMISYVKRQASSQSEIYTVKLVASWQFGSNASFVALRVKMLFVIFYYVRTCTPSWWARKNYCSRWSSTSLRRISARWKPLSRLPVTI